MPTYTLVVFGAGGGNFNHLNFEQPNNKLISWKKRIDGQFTRNQYIEEYEPNVDFNDRKQVMIDSELCVAEVVDTGDFPI